MLSQSANTLPASLPAPPSGHYCRSADPHHHRGWCLYFLWPQYTCLAPQALLKLVLQG